MKNIPIMKPYLTEKEAEAVKQVLLSGWVAQGPKVVEFEEKVAAHEGVAFGVATTSCTTALHLLMAAMGLKAGQDVIVPSFTFVATANAVEYFGATAILVDIDLETFDIDTTKLKEFLDRQYNKTGNIYVNKDTGNLLWGIIPVNEFGLCADIPEINRIAREYGIRVIEDSACAMGASINGVHEGAFGNPSCLSFHPRKSITTGEGGMILCNDGDLAEHLKHLRSHGASISEIQRHSQKGYLLPEYNEIGYNYRMTDIQAVIGSVQMDQFEYITESRRELAARYNSLLTQSVDFLKTPYVPDGYYHTYQSYVCLVDMSRIGSKSVNEAHIWRNSLMDQLEQNGIATRQGTHAVHTLGYYRDKYGYQASDLPAAYQADRLSIALPLYVSLTHEDQDYVIEHIRRIGNGLRGRSA